MGAACLVKHGYIHKPRTAFLTCRGLWQSLQFHVCLHLSIINTPTTPCICTAITEAIAELGHLVFNVAKSQCVHSTLPMNLMCTPLEQRTFDPFDDCDTKDEFRVSLKNMDKKLKENLQIFKTRRHVDCARWAAPTHGNHLSK